MTDDPAPDQREDPLWKGYLRPGALKPPHTWSHDQSLIDDAVRAAVTVLDSDDTDGEHFRREQAVLAIARAVDWHAMVGRPLPGHLVDAVTRVVGEQTLEVGRPLDYASWYAALVAMGLANAKGLTKRTIQIVHNGLREFEKFHEAAKLEGEARAAGSRLGIDALAELTGAGRRTVIRWRQREDWEAVVRAYCIMERYNQQGREEREERLRANARVCRESSGTP